MLRRGIEALVGAALVVAMVALLPAVAEAQSIATSQEAVPQGADANPARVVVVSPGDSLWSISAERLGGGATSQEVAKGVEQIYALNRDQIGPDPNQIVAGQRLWLPAAMGSADAPRRPDAKAATPPAAPASPKVDSASHAISTAKKAPAVGSETPSLPKVADSAPAVPAVSKAASNDSQTYGFSVASLLTSARSAVTSAASAEDRRTLGWTILALTVLVVALMAWKLPMKRTIRSDAERWGIPPGYYGGSRYAYSGSRYAYSGNLDVGMPEPEREESRAHFTPAAQHSEALLRGDLQEHLHPHERNPAVEALVPLEQRTNGSKANGAGTEASPNGGPPNGGIQARRENVL